MLVLFFIFLVNLSQASLCEKLLNLYTGTSRQIDLQKVESAEAVYQDYAIDSTDQNGKLITSYKPLPENLKPKSPEQNLALVTVLANAGGRKNLDLSVIFSKSEQDTSRQKRLQNRLIFTLNELYFAPGVKVSWDPQGFRGLRLISGILPWIRISISGKPKITALVDVFNSLYKINLATKALLDERAEIPVSRMGGIKALLKATFTQNNEEFISARIEKELWLQNLADGMEKLDQITPKQAKILKNQFGHKTYFPYARNTLKILFSAVVSWANYDLTGVPIPFIYYLRLTERRNIPKEVLNQAGILPPKQILKLAAPHLDYDFVTFADRIMLVSRKTLSNIFIAMAGFAMLDFASHADVIIDGTRFGSQGAVSTHESRASQERESFNLDAIRAEQVMQVKKGFLAGQRISKTDYDAILIKLLVVDQKLIEISNTDPFPLKIPPKHKNAFFKAWTEKHSEEISKLQDDLQLPWLKLYARSFLESYHYNYFELTEKDFRLYP